MHAKRFMKALEENVQRYEVANGKIQDLEQIEIPLNFGGPSIVIVFIVYLFLILFCLNFFSQSFFSVFLFP